jgi:hypothetical protein
MNDTNLKILLAKMLPETVYLDTQNILCWPVHQQCGHPVLDTELLYLCAMVEAESGLNSYPLRERYLYKLMDIVKEDGRDTMVIFATWQQRVTALAQVKGVTL